jgi:hypothetical protein
VAAVASCGGGGAVVTTDGSADATPVIADGGGPSDGGTVALDAFPSGDTRALPSFPSPFPDAAPDIIPDEPCGPSDRPFFTAKLPIVDAFPTRDAILVVQQDSLLLVARNGQVMKTVQAPRQITTVQFDGERLIVGDRAMLVVYSTTLEEKGSVLLRESCSASALVATSRLVCGPANDWDRVFYTYDIAASPPALLARSTRTFTYDGIPLRGVPGTAYFMTGSGSFLKVGPTGDATTVASSYSSSVRATGPVAFFGRPPTHVITAGGQMLRIFGNGCDGMTNTYDRGCFIKDGELGTAQSFLALANDEAGARVYGLVGGGNAYSYDPPCAMGCALKEIDVAGRKVVSERRHTLEIGPVVSARHDATCSRLLLVYGKSGARGSYPGDVPAEYQAALLGY